MKKVLLIIFSAVLVVASTVGISYKYRNFIQSVLKYSNIRETIVIDAGHGGVDVGTIGVDGALEKNINLSIALDLFDFLMVSGINAKLIRAGDYEFYNDNETRSRSDLYNRLDFVNSIEKSILISIHQNHYTDESKNGTQIWYSANNDRSKIFADKILKSINENLEPNNKRENKESDNSYYILYKATVPSIMIECGFMSNIEENKKLQDENYQKDMAYSILIGVSEEI